MHVAIIMDGNGRWAERRGLRRTAGHRAGARAVRRIVEVAVRMDIDVLTLYAFSADNWSRPTEEVQQLMRLLKFYLSSETARCLDNGVKVNVIGRRDRLSRDLVKTIERTERLTATGDRLTLQLAVDYSAREAILRAANSEASDDSAQGFTTRIGRVTHSQVPNSSVDLMIRTGGERRLSDFLLWECAYAELVFLDEFWPDVDESMLAAALREFHGRERRYGGVPAKAMTEALRDAR